MSDSRTEAGVSCELPGALADSDEGKARSEDKPATAAIPPMDQKVPDKIRTATFAMG